MPDPPPQLRARNTAQLTAHAADIHYPTITVGTHERQECFQHAQGSIKVCFDGGGGGLDAWGAVDVEVYAGVVNQDVEAGGVLGDYERAKGVDGMGVGYVEGVPL